MRAEGIQLGFRGDVTVQGLDSELRYWFIGIIYGYVGLSGISPQERGVSEEGDLKKPQLINNAVYAR